ncbi:hypothetical protein [Arenimonas fontis]|uniref:DUF1232 domain-containing protein n=1 Tax=Arenimonas fontis TaxID=2608255 RepID=A0A5B2ZE31_9GAMM|nr:hypothetical protein [Arenimonas fontis]KAA2286259.1 hypothetical protein F0415_01820 [Arenimonas fontis]
MRHDAPLPAGQALPLRGAPAGPGATPVPLAPAAIAAFNDLLHELHPDAPHVDQAALASMARWLDGLPVHEAEALLQARLGRLEELRRMCEDPDWQLEPALARRIRRLLDYVEQTRDLIPDDLPRLGRLDDALLVELAWPMIADELEDFRDFCRFRDENGGHADRERWLRTRLEEGALWEQLHRVRNQHYVDYGPLEGGLRVV